VRLAIIYLGSCLLININTAWTYTKVLPRKLTQKPGVQPARFVWCFRRKKLYLCIRSNLSNAVATVYQYVYIKYSYYAQIMIIPQNKLKAYLFSGTYTDDNILKCVKYRLTVVDVWILCPTYTYDILKTSCVCRKYIE